MGDLPTRAKGNTAMAETAHERMMAQLRLALSSDCGCRDTLARMEGEARGSGLTGAEIDAAREGRSFEARTEAAIRFACAIRTGDKESISQSGARARRFGLDADELATIEALVRTLRAG